MIPWYLRFTHLSRPVELLLKASRTVEAIRSYTLRRSRNSSFSTGLCVFCVRVSARKIHTNLSYNLGSPQATPGTGLLPYSLKSHIVQLRLASFGMEWGTH